ncbi:MAG TPA: malto-oligosyltrehalose trehalohydrolase, partial [Opitutaceae bacterium]|nr:malto-oligosyltrehalose trehalohydrolase [Opitutaceae bacterium]
MPNERETACREFGARVGPSGVHYSVWAPGKRCARVTIHGTRNQRIVNLKPEPEGFWSGCDESGRAGDTYLITLDDDQALPDIASRFQPHGVHRRSECIDPAAFEWRCANWQRPKWTGQSIYEIHVGALTQEGTFRAAAQKLSQIRDLRVEAVELMPLADFHGERNWGYDGVCLFAPARCYGRPDDLRAFVDQAHVCGLAVVLDVVYNHLGPQGNYLAGYSPDFFRSDRSTPWGQSFNLDGESNGPVREFLLSNAAHWLDEYRFDGLRLDATHAIPDNSDRHLLAEIAELAATRGAFIIAEDERNLVDVVRPAREGGLGFDALWADDFHHQVRVATTGTRRNYFSAYDGTSRSLATTIANGWFYKGEPYPPWNGRPRGTVPRDVNPAAFIHCIENHDQVGNRHHGERLEHLVAPEVFRAASMLLCLEPHPIMVFMGQEWASSSPFLFFTNHGGELGSKIIEGRMKEFPADHDGDRAGDPSNPEDEAAFNRSKLNWDERKDSAHARTLELYSTCL